MLKRGSLRMREDETVFDYFRRSVKSGFTRRTGSEVFMTRGRLGLRFEETDVMVYEGTKGFDIIDHANRVVGHEDLDAFVTARTLEYQGWFKRRIPELKQATPIRYPDRINFAGSWK
jgi:hypothetical protein